MNKEQQQGYDDRLIKGIKAKNPYTIKSQRIFWQEGFDAYEKTLGEKRYVTRTEAYEFGEFGPTYIVGHVWHADERYDMK